MSRYGFASRLLAILFVLAMGSLALFAPTQAWAQSQGSCEMYRLYNPNSGEHFYTACKNCRP